VRGKRRADERVSLLLLRALTKGDLLT